MRFVYVDEAGIEKEAPHTIITGLIVDADKQVLLVETLINELFNSIPKSIRESVLSKFSAKRIWNDPKIREHWSMNDRLKFMQRLMLIPSRLKIPTAFCIFNRTHTADYENYSMNISLEQYQHMTAFAYCMCWADGYIRNHCGPTETGAVIAENSPNMENHLRQILKIARKNPLYKHLDTLRPTKQEKKQGYSTQEGDYRIERIRNSIFFAKKDDDPILYLADACAFGLRRHFAKEKFGKDFCEAILGGEILDLDDWGTGSSVGLRNF